MPQTYAHQYFGKRIIELLPQEINKTIAEYPELFDIGLQGPDILFYYHPLFHNPTSDLGFEIHEESGKKFFTHAANKLKSTDDIVKAEAGMVYIYGCLCHFALDCTCHSYINDYDETTEGITHSVIEGEFDRLLIEKEGRIPTDEDMVKCIHPSKAAAEVICDFYEGVSSKRVYSALKSFVRFHNILRCPGDKKRSFILGALKVLGQYESLRGHVTSPDQEPLCVTSDRELERLLEEAVPKAVSLISGFSENLQYDTLYELNFEGVNVQK